MFREAPIFTNPSILLNFAKEARHSIPANSYRNYSIGFCIEGKGSRDEMVGLFRDCVFHDKVRILLDAQIDRERDLRMDRIFHKGRSSINNTRETEILTIAEETGFSSPISVLFPSESLRVMKDRAVVSMKPILFEGKKVGKICTKISPLRFDTSGTVIYPNYSVARIISNSGKTMDLLNITGKIVTVRTTDFDDCANPEEGTTDLSNPFGSFADLLTYFHECDHHTSRADNPDLAKKAREVIESNINLLRYSPEQPLQPLTEEQAIALLQQEERPWVGALEKLFSVYDLLEIPNQKQLRQDALRFAESCFSTYVETVRLFLL